MRKFLVSGLLSLLTFFCLSTVPKNLSADALSILSNTPASMLDLGLLKLEKHLKRIGEDSYYPNAFKPPRPMYLHSTSAQSERQRGIEIQGSSIFQIFATKEDALAGCEKWLKHMRVEAGYDVVKQKYTFDRDSAVDDRASHFVEDFNDVSGKAIRGIREAIEDKIRLYCDATFREPKFGFIQLYAKIGEVGFQQLK